MDARSLVPLSRRGGLIVPLLTLWLAAAATAGVKYSRPTAIFTFEQHPDLPLEDFASGRLGLVRPTWARAHLYAAYRRIDGVNFSPTEVAEYVAYVQGRLGQQQRFGEGLERFERSRRDLGLPWQAPTRQAPALTMAGDYTYSLLCADDAFATAADTLEARVASFGSNSREVAEWVRGQDHVFENCYHPEAGVLPPPAPRDINPLIQADRDYQQGAALFYNLRFEAARSQFRRIAADPSSPWATWAPYLAGRSQLWFARILEGQGAGAYANALALAERDFRAVLEDDALRPTHDAARYLLARILFRRAPQDAASLLAARLMSPLGENGRDRELRLFTELLDDAVLEGRVAQLREAHDLIDWIYCYQSTEPAEREYALARWKQSGSIAWLLAALTKVPGDHPDVPAMLHAAVEVGDHPATPALFFEQARILLERGERDLARNVLDDLLPRLEGLPSAQNRVLALRAKAARGFNDFFEAGVRSPALVAGVFWPDGRYYQPWWEEDWFQQSVDERRARLAATRRIERLAPEAADALNSVVPVRLLARVAQQMDIPDPIRAQLMGAAWTRALVLGDFALAREISAELAALEPDLAVDLSRFDNALPDRAELEGALTLLYAPGLTLYVRSERLRESMLDEMDPLGLNWWQHANEDPVETFSADFVTPAQAALARQEWERLRAAPNGHDWILEKISAEAEAGSADPRIPEALYLLAACLNQTDLAFGYYPRPMGDALPVIELLERHYPGSGWTAQAKRDTGPWVNTPSPY